MPRPFFSSQSCCEKPHELSEGQSVSPVDCVSFSIAAPALRRREKQWPHDFTLTQQLQKLFHRSFLQSSIFADLFPWAVCFACPKAFSASCFLNLAFLIFLPFCLTFCAEDRVVIIRYIYILCFGPRCAIAEASQTASHIFFLWFLSQVSEWVSEESPSLPWRSWDKTISESIRIYTYLSMGSKNYHLTLCGQNKGGKTQHRS